nr:RING-H2 finger protein ATL16-like [Ipomoea batatas]
MDLSSHGRKLFTPIPTPPSFSISPPQSARATFLITATVVVLATSMLLISLYVIKCYTNCQRFGRLRRFSRRSGGGADEGFVVSSPEIVNGGGLDRSLIESIPTYEFKRAGERNSSCECECAVCLNEFQEGEKLRVIPHCGHGFHIDCIDVWLINNANCPLCRNCISSSAIFSNPGGSGYFTAGSNEDDCVVIELDEDRTVINQYRLSISPSPTARKNPRKSRRVFSVGDECIDIREKDERFAVQPMRRSFSMDSAADRRVYLAVQKAVQQHKRRDEIISSGESSSSSRINKKSFFSFGYGRGSKNSVQTAGSFGTLTS